MTGMLLEEPAPTTVREGETVHIVAWRLLDYDGNEPTYGGLQRWLLALTDLLRATGHEVLVHQRAHRAFERALENGTRVLGHRCKPRATATPFFNARVHRSIPEGSPVVYMADDLTWPICRRRSVLVQHGVWWDGEFGWWKHRAVEHIVRHAVRRVGAAICVDTNFINWFRARWPESGVDHKLHYVPNFIDTERWGPQPEVPAAAHGDPVTICFPRRSEPRRGIYLMAEVAPRLIARHQGVQFRFVVGSGYYTEQLRDRLRAAGAPEDRFRIEVLPFDRMREAYERSAIVTIPTLCGEGTSLSAIEAMYFGCAVVGTWVGGLPNLIQTERNGLLIPPRSADLERALDRLITDRALRTRLGTQAMADVLPQFGIERWNESTREVLRAGLGIEAEVRP